MADYTNLIQQYMDGELDNHFTSSSGSFTYRTTSNNEMKFGATHAFSVNIDSGTWFYHGSQKSSGNFYTWLTKNLGHPVETAIHILKDAGLWEDREGYTPKPLTKAEADKIEQNKQQNLKIAQEKQAEHKLKAEKQDARLDKIIKELQPIAGTPAEKYLESRKCCTQAPDLFYSKLYYSNTKKEEHCLVIRLRDAFNYKSIVGVHRIYLTADGKKIDKKCKMLLTYSWTKNKDTLCVAYFYNPDATSLEVGICEGPEDALSLKKKGYANMVSCISSTTLAKFPYYSNINLTVFTDRDKAGMEALDKVHHTYATQGKDIKEAIPPAPYKDFNEYILNN